jgi:hypothetical protein
LATHSRHRFLAPRESCFATDPARGEALVAQHLQLSHPAVWPPVALADRAAVDRNRFAARVKHDDARVCEVVTNEPLESTSLPRHTGALQADILAVELIEPGIVVMSVHARCATDELHVAGWAEQSESADVHLEVVR